MDICSETRKRRLPMAMPAARVNVDVIIAYIIYRCALKSIVCRVVVLLFSQYLSVPRLQCRLFVFMWEPVGEYVLLFTIDSIFERDLFFFVCFIRLLITAI
jgi:ABC-type tungstate transport system substrate-binding protein